MDPKLIRNVGIIAHVDHGKTTLVDALLKQSGAFGRHVPIEACVMDSNELERERGITILAKNTAITHEGFTINIVDTPGHADFGGEVERILRMVDSVILLVDSCEGPMPQTRFVLKKSLALGLCPLVVINKIDRPDRRPDDVLNAIFDLFVNLGASDAQLDFPHLYASGRDGWAVEEFSDDVFDRPGKNLEPLFKLILTRVPAPPSNVDEPLQMQVATLDYNDFLGRIAIGRIYRGQTARGDRAVLCKNDGARIPFRVTKMMGFAGLNRYDVERAYAGDIIALAGVGGDVTVGETICPEEFPDPLTPIAIDEPTLSMDFIVNNSPFAGREGKYVTSRNLRDRLDKELQHNVSLRVEETDSKDTLKVSGRGTLSLSILIETMRREGFELQVSQPKVITRAVDGKVHEPYEEVVIECAEPYSGIVIEKLSARAGELTDLRVGDDGVAHIEFRIPSRGLIGYRSQFLTDTRGTGTFYHAFAEYAPWKGDLRRRQNGVLVVQDNCETVTYGLFHLQDRGAFFCGPGEAVYAGQVVGIHNRDNDLVINPGKEKKLSNMRSSGSDEKLFLTPPKKLSLEDALEFIDDDELVEITPKSLRLRKRVLDHSARKRFDKAS